MTAATYIRTKLNQPGMMIVPGVHDGMSAQMARQAGFDTIFLGSYAITASAFGMPDSGLVPVPQLIETYRKLTETSGLPALCDVDDGGGSTLKIGYNMHLVEQAGLAGIQMEDLDLAVGKYLPGKTKQLLPVPRMVSHIKAALDARTNKDTLVMARCDARDVGTLSEAVDRVGAYSEAGADLILVPFLEIEEIPQIKAAISCHLAHMFIPTDRKDAADVERARTLGVKYLMYPVLSVWAAGRAIEEAFVELRDKQSDATRGHGAATWKLVNEAVQSERWSAFA